MNRSVDPFWTTFLYNQTVFTERYIMVETRSDLPETVHIIRHAMLDHKMSMLRSNETDTDTFWNLLTEIATIMAVEMTRELPTTLKPIITPMESMDAPFIATKKLCLAPVLRAGLGMAPGFKHIIPRAKTAHISLKRDEQTFEAKRGDAPSFPDKLSERLVLVLDPMCATGGTAVEAINILKENGARNIMFANIICAKEGLVKVYEHHPDVQIYTCAVDRQLNESAYILPGLGDAGDRAFGTV